MTTSLESDLTLEINSFSHNPSQTERLGDIGFVDNSGRWRRVLNIADTFTCEKLGIQAIQRTHELKEYVMQRPRNRCNELYVKVSPGGSYQILTPTQLCQYVYNLCMSLYLVSLIQTHWRTWRKQVQRLAIRI